MADSSAGSPRGIAVTVLVAAMAVALTVSPLATQPPLTRSATPDVPSRSAWVVVAPDAALAWFDLLAALRLEGPGALSFTAATSTSDATAALARSSLAITLAATSESEVLHFVPLYFPSGDRPALASALRAAAGTAPSGQTLPHASPTPRATLLIAALRQSMTAPTRTAVLPALADAYAIQPGLEVSNGDLRRWQRLLDSVYVPALGPWLALERLDAGRVIVAPAIGAEGRLFAATADRGDNIMAVGRFTDDAVADAPLLAFVRETCFPAVTRALNAARLSGSRGEIARRSSLAAVRCGARLMDLRLPARADAYRAFWLRQVTVGSRGSDAEASPQAGADTAGADTTGARRRHFDRVFPSDPALEPSLIAALARIH